MKIKIIVTLLVLAISAIFFNASIVHRDDYTRRDDLTDEIAAEMSNLFEIDVDDNLSLHLGGDSAVESIMDDIVEDGLSDLTQDYPELVRRKYIYNNKKIADESWRAWPRCKSSDSSDQSGGRVNMTLWYDLNVDKDSLNLKLNSITRNKINVDLNLNQAKVYYQIKFTRYRCGKIKWTRELTAEAGKVRLSADARFSFNGSDFRLEGISNEKIHNLEWPDLESDSKIVDLIGEMVDKGSFVNNLCTQTNCLNTYVVPLLKDFLDWDSVIGSIANEAMKGIKDKIQLSSSVGFDGVNGNVNLNFNNILLGANKGASVLVGSNMNLRGRANNCARDLNPPAFASSFSSTDEKLGTSYSVKLGTNFLSGFTYAALKRGLLCQNFTMDTGLPSGKKIDLSLRPYGDMSIGKGDYYYNLRKRYTPHADNIPYVGDARGFVKDAGSSPALKLTVPIKLDGSGTISSSLTGEMDVYFLLESSASNDIQLVIKRIVLTSLVGQVSVGGIAITAADIKPKLEQQLGAYTEVRVQSTQEYKCHEGSRRAEGRELTQDDYTLTRDDQSIYYYETSNYSQNCANCASTVSSDISFLNFDSKTKKISLYQVDNNGLRLAFGGTALFSSETSNEPECPNISLTDEEQEQLDDSREELDERMEEALKPQDQLRPGP